LHVGKPAADDEEAKYVLWFGDTNSAYVTANVTAFQNALASPAPNWSTLVKKSSASANPTPVPIPALSPAPPNTVLISGIHVVQQEGPINSPSTMHVTQKVGLNSPAQVASVLAALNPQ